MTFKNKAGLSDKFLSIFEGFKKDLKLASKYFDELSSIGNIYSIGRNGTYKYGVDIDDCIRQAMQVKELIEKNTYNYCITHKDYIFTD